MRRTRLRRRLGTRRFAADRQMQSLTLDVLRNVAKHPYLLHGALGTFMLFENDSPEERRATFERWFYSILFEKTDIARRLDIERPGSRQSTFQHTEDDDDFMEFDAVTEIAYGILSLRLNQMLQF